MVHLNIDLQYIMILIIGTLKKYLYFEKPPYDPNTYDLEENHPHTDGKSPRNPLDMKLGTKGLGYKGASEVQAESPASHVQARSHVAVILYTWSAKGLGFNTK